MTASRFSSRSRRRARGSVAILATGKPDTEVVDADVFLLTDHRPTLLSGPGIRLAGSQPTSATLLSDLRSDADSSWVPAKAWLSYLKLSAPAGRLDYDLATDVTGHSPRLLDTGLVRFAGLHVPGGRTRTAWPWAATLAVVLSALVGAAADRAPRPPAPPVPAPLNPRPRAGTGGDERRPGPGRAIQVRVGRRVRRGLPSVQAVGLPGRQRPPGRASASMRRRASASAACSVVTPRSPAVASTPRRRVLDRGDLGERTLRANSRRAPPRC